MTRRSLLPLVFPLLVTLAVAACDDDGTSPLDDAIRGTVVDESGAPVAGAAILANLEIAAEKPQVTIRYGLPEPARCRVWVETPCGETVRTLVDGLLPAGSHSFVWDAHDDQGLRLSDGLFLCQLRIGESAETQQREIFLGDGGYLDAPDPALWHPLATTDARGRFSIDQGCLGFGWSIEGTDELGNPTVTLTVTRQVRLWALAAGRLPGASGWLEVDGRFGAQATIRAGGPIE